MIKNRKKKIPVKEGLFTIPHSANEKPQLIAGRCSHCGEIFFPKREICQNCQGRNLEEIRLSREGKIFSYTVMYRTPGTYRGPIPYAFGWVELPEGVRVETLYTGIELEKLKVGLDVELVVEKLCDDEEGNEIICHKFRPLTTQASLGAT